MERNIHHKNFAERRKSLGVCVICGKQLDRVGYRCIECNDKLKSYDKLSRKYYQENHVCPRCRKNSIVGDEKQCLECKVKRSEQVMSKRNRDRYNFTHKEWSKNEYERRKQLGICIRCGKRKSDGGYFTCGICRSKGREYKRIKYGKPDRSEHCEMGLCFFCDNPVKDGYKVCEKHYQMNLDNSRSEKVQGARKIIKKIEHNRFQSMKAIKGKE